MLRTLNMNVVLHNYSWHTNEPFWYLHMENCISWRDPNRWAFWENTENPPSTRPYTSLLFCSARLNLVSIPRRYIEQKSMLYLQYRPLQIEPSSLALFLTFFFFFLNIFQLDNWYPTGLVILASNSRWTTKWTIMSKIARGYIFSSLQSIKTMSFSNLFISVTYKVLQHICWKKKEITQLMEYIHHFANTDVYPLVKIDVTTHDYHEFSIMISNHPWH